MLKDQKFTPKYWVGYNKTIDDVFLSTAAKSRADTVSSMEELFGDDWFMDDDFEVILIEINTEEM